MSSHTANEKGKLYTEGFTVVTGVFLPYQEQASPLQLTKKGHFLKTFTETYLPYQGNLNMLHLLNFQSQLLHRNVM